MKVFHGPVNISGMAGVLAKAQRELGAKAVSYGVQNQYNYQVDEVFPNAREPFSYLKFMLKHGLRYDIYQFYFGNSLTGTRLSDIKLLKLLRKKIFFYFCGCDIRDSKKVIETYQYSACKQCWPMHCSSNRLKVKALAEEYAKGIFVSTPDLLEFVKGAVLLPQPIELEYFTKLRKPALESSSDKREKLKIVHAPSNSQIKGTYHIQKAINNLQGQGYPMDFILLRNYTHAEVMKICSDADIIVDQLLIGAYGQYSVEGMALGKPVVCYIREDLENKYPTKLPLINANIENFEEKLKELIINDELREQTGKHCYEYVAEVHDARVIAEKTLNYYRI